MSNAMRMGKRTLAGVAAGALTLGALTVASATTASAAPSIKPKAAITNTVTAVRAGAVGTIPSARLKFAKTAAKPTQLYLVTAPAGARIYLNNSPASAPAATDDSATTAVPDTSLTTVGTVSGDDSTYGFAVDTAGGYTAALGNGTDTATFTFTARTAPASMTLTPASTTVLVGGTATLTATLLDSGGNVTQPAFGDTVALTTSGDDTLTPTSFSAATLYQGANTLTVLTDTAGTQTITATPQGSLPSLGVTAQTATVTASGTVSSSAVTNIQVTTPANAINLVDAPTQAQDAQVPANTTTVTLTVDDTTANAAGSQIRLAVNANAVGIGGSINGSAVASVDDTKYLDATTNASKQATFTFTLAGATTQNGVVLSYRQVKVDNSNVTVGGSPTATVSVLNPQVYASSITISPDDSLVAALGATTNVNVTVEDSFGTPQSGWSVRAYRGADWSTGVLLSTNTTNGSGVAIGSLINASTAVNNTVEKYSFTVTPPVGSQINLNDQVQITYTTGGAIALLTVNATAGSSPTSAAPTQTKGARFNIPNAGALSGGPAGAASTFTVSTSADDTTAISANYAQFSAIASPTNAVTVTTPEGVFVTDDTTTATWSNGEREAVVTSGTNVYVYGTKAGVHDVTFKSGDKTVVVKVKIGNTAAMAYNIALSPPTQTIGSGAIGTATLTVTDIFGNPVQTSTTNGYVTVSASGEVLLAGYQTSASFVTNASGTATVTVIAGVSAGTGTLAAGPATGDGATAWQPLYVKPTGAPTPVTSAAATVTVTGSPETKTIVITGERTTVGGKPGIMVDGVTTGFAAGDKVKPWVKFPGESSYSEGSARPEIDADGEFSWQRKTGKKIYVYFTNEAGDVKSDRIIIPAV